jgi:hypothetical protein
MSERAKEQTMDVENQTENEESNQEDNKTQAAAEETQNAQPAEEGLKDAKKNILHEAILKAEESLGKKEEDKNVKGKPEDKLEDKQGKKEDVQTNDKDKEDGKGEVKVKPLEHWNDKQKTFFNGLPQAQQQTVLDMFNGVQKVYEKKTLELASKQKELSSIENVFKPYDELIKKQGIDKAQYIGSLIELDKFSANDPIGFIVDFMAKRGINMDHVFSGIKQYVSRESNPAYKQAQKYEREAKELRGKIDTQKSEEINKSIEQFKTAKDRSGNLLYPHFDTVQELMAQISMATGKTDLGELYEKAAWLHPEVREKLLESERQTAAASVTQEQVKRKQVDKVKSAAGLRFSNSNGVSKNPKPPTLKEIIENLDEQTIT